MLKSMVDYGRPRNLSLCLSINPSLWARPALNYSSPGDLDRMVEKLKSVYDTGIRSFALCCDDISLDLQNPDDKAAFHDLGAAQVDWMRRLADRLAAEAPGSHLIFCPTTYSSTSVNDARTREYIATIGAGLPQDIQVFWTGPVTCSPFITDQDADRFGALIQRKPFVWDNYPVNDYCPTRLYLGPVKQRSPTLFQRVAGWISNPMMESHASRLPLSTVANYLWNPTTYQADVSLQAAAILLAGPKASGDVLAVESIFGDFLGEPPRLPAAPSVPLAEAKGSLARVAGLEKRLSRRPELKLFAADVRPILDRYSTTLNRRILTATPRLWKPSRGKLTLAGEEFAGGGADVYGSHYENLPGCNWVYADGTGLGKMQARFILQRVPKRDCLLTIDGKDDDAPGPCPIRVSLNGKILFEGPGKLLDDTWSTMVVNVPRDYLVPGINILNVENSAPEGQQGMPPWFMVHSVTLARLRG